MRRPAGKRNDLECRRDQPILAAHVGVKGGGAVKYRLFGRSAQPGGQGIAFTHGAQVVHQVKSVAVTDRGGKAVGNRQRESGTLQQAAKVANLTHRQYAGRQSSGHI